MPFLRLAGTSATSERMNTCSARTDARGLHLEATTRRCTPEFLYSRRCWFRLGRPALKLEGRLTHPRWRTILRRTNTRQSYGRKRSLASAPRCKVSIAPASEFYTSGRTSNEAAFPLSTLRRKFGPMIFPDCSNMSSGNFSWSGGKHWKSARGPYPQGFRSRRCDIHLWPESGTNGPRMMSAQKLLLHFVRPRRDAVVPFWME